MGIKSFTHMPGEASDDIDMLCSCCKNDLMLRVYKEIVPSGSLTNCWSILANRLLPESESCEYWTPTDSHLSQVEVPGKLFHL